MILNITRKSLLTNFSRDFLVGIVLYKHNTGDQTPYVAFFMGSVDKKDILLKNRNSF